MNVLSPSSTRPAKPRPIVWRVGELQIFLNIDGLLAVVSYIRNMWHTVVSSERDISTEVLIFICSITKETVIDDTGECIEDQLTEKRFKSDLSTVLYEVRHWFDNHIDWDRMEGDIACQLGNWVSSYIIRQFVKYK